MQGVYPKLGWKPDNKWQGRIPHEEMPYVINPKSGYVVSANNHVSSENVQHGISHAFTFPGRKSRISELLEEAFKRTGDKVTVKDMQAIQFDLLDIQARTSLPDMLLCVRQASIPLNPKQSTKVDTALSLLE